MPAEAMHDLCKAAHLQTTLSNAQPALYPLEAVMTATYAELVVLRAHVTGCWLHWLPTVDNKHLTFALWPINGCACHWHCGVLPLSTECHTASGEEAQKFLRTRHLVRIKEPEPSI